MPDVVVRDPRTGQVESRAWVPGTEGPTLPFGQLAREAEQSAEEEEER